MKQRYEAPVLDVIGFESEDIAFCGAERPMVR